MRLFFVVLAAVAAGAAFAVDTHFWILSSKEDYDKATLHRLSLRSDGRITLAPAVKELHDGSVSYLWAVARGANGTVYTGGGNPGATSAKLFAVSGGQSKLLAELPGLQIQAIATDGSGRVYAATAPDGKVYRVAADGKFEVFYDPKAKYIWSLAFDQTGNLFVATGDRGEIHKVTAAGQGSVFFKTEEEHARSLVVDSRNNVIAGTEPGGLILRISPAGEGFVLHQSGRREVTALAIAPDGAIYAAAVGSKPNAPAAAPPAAPSAVTISSTSITVTASGSSSATTTAPGRAPAPPPTLTPASVTGGSELIRVAPDGFPSRVWSDGAEIVYAISFDKAGLPVIGTGNKGNVYRIDSDLVSTRLLSLAPTQVTALVNDSTGAIYATTGNIGKLFQIGPGLEKDGTLESEVLDAGWFAEWGRLGSRTEGNVRFDARSGNVDRTQKNWSAWTPVNERINAPASRFVQYRATLSGDAPALVSTDVAYLPRNVAPKIERIEITQANYRFPAQSINTTPLNTLTLASMSSKNVSGASSPESTDPGGVTLTFAKGHIGARWKAGDANGDAVVYSVEIRGRSEQVWKPLKKDLTVRQFSWDGNTMPDGEYVLRVTASDAAANSPGKGLSNSLESDPFLIDNTPPAISALAATMNSGKMAVNWNAIDAGTILTKAEYSVNGGPWMYAEPTTGLSDSKAHRYSLALDRPAGEVTVAVRVTDENDNVAVDKTILK